MRGGRRRGSLTLRLVVFVGVCGLALLCSRPSGAAYVGVDGFYGAIGIDRLLSDLTSSLLPSSGTQHGGGGKITFGIGRKWITEFSGGVFYGRQYKRVSGTTDDSNLLQSIISGVRRPEPQLFFVFGVEGRYHLFGETAYDPEVANDLFFGLGGEWHAPSFWQDSDYLIAVPAVKFISGYSARMTSRLFFDIALEVFALPTPPSNLVNLRLGFKYAF